MKYFQFLDNDYRDREKFQWDRSLDWVEVTDVVNYGQKINVYTKHDMLRWCNAPNLWVVEVAEDAKKIACKGYEVVSKARLLRRVDEWNPANQRAFAVDCAERVLRNWEAVRSGDGRAREALMVLKNSTQGQEDWKRAQSLAYTIACYPIWWAFNSNAHLASYHASTGTENTYEQERTWQINHLLTHYLNLNPEDFA